MYYSGLRIGEAVLLTVDCVDAAHMTLRVVGKGNKERLAPLSPALYHDLRQAWRTHGTKPWLFPNRRHTGPVNVHMLEYAFRCACEQAGLDSVLVKPHTLRHSFATHLHEQGILSETVRILLGHSSVEMTKRYLHLLEASSDKVSGALDTFCKPSMRYQPVMAALELADVFRRFASSYFAAYGAAMPPSHLRAIEDVLACHTKVMGGHVYQCQDCGERIYVLHGCGNRACPSCHYAKTVKWLEARREQMLPCPYYHVVFTLPEHLRALVRSNQYDGYGILMKAAVQALMTACDNRKYLGATPAVMAVLHTWTATMEYHPHIHMLVSAGGVNGNEMQWRRPPRGLSGVLTAKWLSASRNGYNNACVTKIYDVFSCIFAKKSIVLLESVSLYVLGKTFACCFPCGIVILYPSVLRRDSCVFSDEKCLC
jgi:hypothetical protein